MPDDDDWTADTAPRINPTGRTPEQRAAGVREDAGGYSIKKHFQFKFEDDIPSIRIKSSVLPNGYETQSFVGLIGPPGTGKTRYALQEVMLAAKEGHSSFYMFNETVEKKFKKTIKRIATELGITHSSDLRNVWFWDATKNQLGTADYNSMEIVASTVWAQNVKYWLDNECKGIPTFIVFDSFSNISRRYVPQTPIFHQYLTHALAEVYAEKKIEPITLMVYQKSLGPREANTDAVVGGYGVNHEVDMEIVLKLHDVDKWDAMRYGWTEGSNVHTLQITKDRFPEAEYQESLILLKDGKLTLSDTINSHVQRTLDAKNLGRFTEQVGSEAGVDW